MCRPWSRHTLPAAGLAASVRPVAGLVVLISLLITAPAGWPAASAPAAKEKQLRELRGRIETLQKRLDEAEGSRTEAADALKDSERAISDANRELRELAGQAREADARLAELRAESGSNQ